MGYILCNRTFCCIVWNIDLVAERYGLTNFMSNSRRSHTFSLLVYIDLMEAMLKDYDRGIML
jgi:hypothetical protein